MPELSNIQTFEKLVGTEYRPTIDRFSNVLKSIDLWNKEIQYAFDSFEWKIASDGFVYSSLMDLDYYVSKLSGTKIRPLVMIYTPALNSTFKENWMCCDLLIEAEELRSFETGQFHHYTYDLVESLTLEMRKEFKETGIYFTDEAQDKDDFDAIRCNDSTKLWHFDYALIPENMEFIYSKPPATHKVNRLDNYFESWYIDRWKKSPYR
jgi:hypothetical protein